MRRVALLVVALALIAGLGRWMQTHDSDGCSSVVPGDREGPAQAVVMNLGSFSTLRYKSLSLYLPGAAKGSLLTSSDPDVVAVFKQPPRHVPGEYEKWLKFGSAVHAGTSVLRMTSDDTGEVYAVRVHVAC